MSPPEQIRAAILTIHGAMREVLKAKEQGQSGPGSTWAWVDTTLSDHEKNDLIVAFLILAFAAAEIL